MLAMCNFLFKLTLAGIAGALEGVVGTLVFDVSQYVLVPLGAFTGLAIYNLVPDVWGGNDA